MTAIRTERTTPVYQGLDWIDGSLPTEVEPWPRTQTYSSVFRPGDEAVALYDQIRSYAKTKPWVWPSRPYLFLTDMHADTDAFLASLVASGGITKTGPGDDDFILTPFGRDAVFVIGGDCFDKGPENLRLLRAINRLKQTGAVVETLVGNHDLRTYIGIACAESTDVRHAHLFVRMGKKTVPLFLEIFQQYLAGGYENWGHLTDTEIRRRLFPSESWYEEFPAAVEGLLSPEKIAKELKRIREKSIEFEDRCQQLGLTLGMVYAALRKARQLFLEPGGEFYSFFNDMKLGLKAGSFLMVHAGVDDQVAAVIRNGGVEALNDAYKSMWQDNLFELYNGSLGNVFRTKYRGGDFPLTESGLKDLHTSGIYGIMHGHRNLLNGQRITLRSGMLNFECDASVDIGTRTIEGLRGKGAAVSIIHPDAHILGISTDYPFIKDFKPTEFCGLTTVI